ncbi:photosynthetic NDH subunit of lumenal location 2, chloroplastic [Iris pallida]|uniref:Photosynthetic NDH subunit of lumenal location 2, chloroplastic n=1 Tax=Iris pallida TaxID=29817 RepID=A0AAX6GNY2_IRIPA|nr:photosynthetic NDH subunit of lumenal location 2, chloroplastic [Iris pallida]
MASFGKQLVLCHSAMAMGSTTGNTRINPPKHFPTLQYSSVPGQDQESSKKVEEDKHPQQQRRRSTTMVLAAAAAAAMLGGGGGGEMRRPVARAAEAWGTRSFIREKYFQPELSPEDAAARIRQTTEGLREMRHMLETMSWKYVKFYVRLKSAYLDSDLKNAMSVVPEGRRSSYVKTANEVVDNMSELDRYIRSPKVYESYLYYEKTLKSLDELVSLLA